MVMQKSECFQEIERKCDEIEGIWSLERDNPGSYM
jgi:hypothetical protein